MHPKLSLEEAIARIGEVLERSERPILIALDGRSGAGKSTVAGVIAERLHGVVITADDFWVGGSNEAWDARTPRERAELAIDWHRIRAEVLEPLLADRPAAWRPFDWEAGAGLSTRPITCEPAPLIVLDGAYSTRPELLDLIELSILVEIPDEVRRARLIAREGVVYMRDWHGRWDVAEDYYFSEVRPRDSFDIIIGDDTLERGR